MVRILGQIKTHGIHKVRNNAHFLKRGETYFDPDDGECVRSNSSFDGGETARLDTKHTDASSRGAPKTSERRTVGFNLPKEHETEK